MATRGSYRKSEQRRQEILLAAIDVFSRRGYRNASIREIAETVGLTQAGLLHHFASKEKLFVEVLRVRDELQQAKTDDMVEALRLGIEQNAQVEGLVHLFVTVSAEAIDETHPGHEFFRSRYDNLIEHLRQRIQSRQDTGMVTSGIDAGTAARMLVALADGIQVQWLLDPDHTDMLGIFDTFWHAVLGAAEGGPAAASAQRPLDPTTEPSAA